MLNLNKKTLALIIALAILLLLSILFLLRKNPNPNGSTENPTPTIVPSTSFAVKSTAPKNKEENVFPGEIKITFTTDVPIPSAKDFTFFLSPPPDVAPQLESTFPTQTVTYQVLGGLKRGVEYTVVVTNKHSQRVAVWNFTTSNDKPESSSKQALEEQEELNKNYYPLFYEVPYENANFQIDYTGRLTLLVKIKKDNVEAIKQEALSWIRGKGVDPATHTIKYQNGF